MSTIDELVERLCPDGVEYKALGEVAKIVGGRDYKHLGKGDIPVYGSGGLMTYVDTAAYDKPTVLLPRKGSISNVFYLDEPFWNVDTVFYTVIDESQMLPRFFYHVILNEHIEKLNTSNAARPALTRTVLDKIRIPVPPMEVQQEIVRVLDLMQELDVALKEEQVERMKQYTNWLNTVFGRIQDVEVIRLGDICELITKGTTPKTIGFPYVNEGVNFIRTESIDANGNLLEQMLAFVGEDCHEQMKRSQLHSGDLLFSIAGAIGRVLLIEEWMLPANTNQALSIIRLKEDAPVSSKFLFFALCSNVVQGQMTKQSTGSAQSNISLKDIASIALPLVSKTQQEKIVDDATELRKYLAALSDEIEARRKQYAYYRDKLLSFPEKVL